MKKYLLSVFAVSVIALMASCTSTNTNSPIIDSSSNEPESSSKEESSESIPTSSSQSSESKSSSSSSQAQQSFVENQLSTESGLKINFKAQGARIDKITWGAKQIAKDGFTVGRCANRIAGGKFSINGTEYSVTKNDGQNSLHGGGRNWQGPFANANWTKVEQTASTITYSISSADGEEGYPGKMDMTVKYTLQETGELTIEYSAQSTKDTLCNPTNHLFMDLNGSGDRNYRNISLWIDADKYTPLKNSLPTGEIANVEGTQFDFRTEKTFDGSKSYDDNLVLNGEGYRKVATMKGTSLGVQVDVYTDRPGLQLYKDGSGNICLETQMFPDAINHGEFESPILQAGVDFYSKTTYHFHSIAQ